MTFSSTADLPSYRYQSLFDKPRCFRAIQFLPSLPSLFPGFSRTLRIQILEVDADNVVPYDALSYTWGVVDGKEPDRPIIIEESNTRYKLLIHRPLETALLRLEADGIIGRPLFVDQISINQGSDGEEEKVVQVPLMRDVYAKCVRTIVWLGDGTRYSNSFFDFVHQVAEEGILSRLMGPHVGHFMTVFDAVVDSSIEVTGVPRQDRDDVLGLIAQFGHRFPAKGMVDVLGRSWFSRLWVIQEACLAPSVTIVCGTRSLCFECFRGGILFFTIYNTYWVNTVSKSVSKADLRRRNALYEMTPSFLRIFQERKAIHIRGRHQSLYDLVLKYSVNNGDPKINASRPEDRIFGLLGLTATEKPLQGIRVRYQDAANVYSEFAALVARETLDVLCFSQFPKTVPLVPSWVPDWSMQLVVPRGYANLSQPYFTAGGVAASDGVPIFRHGVNTLTVSGILVDRIIRVGTQSIHRDPDKPVVDQIDYRSAKRFFDETEDFMRQASAIHEVRAVPQETAEEKRLDLAIRLSDFGLTARHFADTPNLEQSLDKLRAAHGQVSRLGQRFLNTDNTVRSYHIDQIFATVGIIPWYWVPAGEIDLLHRCAVAPVLTALYWLKGAGMFLTDVVGMCLASAAMVATSRFLRFRRRFTGVLFHPPNHASMFEKLGLDLELTLSVEMTRYTEHLYKNIGQKLYLTKDGYLGTGPLHMDVGDRIVVLRGATTPHVIREVLEDVRGTSKPPGWEYVGEAYCDGIMDGELFSDERREALPLESFELR